MRLFHFESRVNKCKTKNRNSQGTLILDEETKRTNTSEHR